MGDRNDDKHTQKEQKANVNIKEEVLYCPQPTNYLQI